jgi:DNA-directed RNA polymerase specialized sigma24 family protein
MMAVYKSRKEIKREMRESTEISGDGMSYHEISNILGISVHEVKKIEYRALMKLKKPNEKNKKFLRYLKEKSHNYHEG